MPDRQPTAPVTVAGLPGDPMDVMAQLLTGHGLTVATTGHEDSRALKVTGTSGTACVVTIAEDWYLTCETSAQRSHPAGTGSASAISSTAMAGMVALMLAAPTAGPQQDRQLHQADTPAGAVGREMDARGLTVTMNVWEDHTAYTASAQIAITSPAHPERGTVHLDNNGYIYWETGDGQAPPSPASLAATIAAVLACQAPAAPDSTRDD